MPIKVTGSFTTAGLLSAFAASLCCITPVVALFAGSSSVAANFSWLQPARPYLIILSIAALLFAWYLKLKPADATNGDCGCITLKKPSFLQSKTFLGMVTLVAILMMAFPLYAKMFYASEKLPSTTVTATSNKQQLRFIIQGMSCQGCEEPVNNELSKLPGVLGYKTSYADKCSLVSFDKSTTNLQTIKAAINKTGYKVKRVDAVNAGNTAIGFE